MRVRSLSLLALVLAAAPALAEKSDVNLHLDLGFGTGLNQVVFANGVALKVDTTLIHALGPVAPQLEVFGLGAAYRTFLADGSAFGAGVGARVRLFNDEQGYLLYPGKKFHGTLWGNAWGDAHLTYSHGGLGVGFDAAVGTEFSLLDGLSVGPFAKLVWTSPAQSLLFGLVFTVGIPSAIPPDADFDDDGLRNAQDKCPEEAGPKENAGCPDTDQDKDGVVDRLDQCPAVPEDRDGFQDDDGCPDLDNDGDGLEDAKDSCPTVKGPLENKGCPDTDRDEDTVVDRLDACPSEKGAPENKGCPWPDQDGDGVTDNVDTCPTEKGPPENKGCPWPDQDGDGVTDNVDNCPAEKGPADNQGCPVKEKQLVVITKEKIVIKEKVYFDTGKATLQKRSDKLLDQVASVLTSHPDLKLVQVEGHTDTTGDAAANRKLSQDRSDSVRAYLVKKGVAPERLKPVGFGPDRPTDSNDTPAGRENNRRVEFNLLEQ